MKSKELKKIKAFEMSARGIKQATIAKELNISTRTLHRWLSSEEVKPAIPAIPAIPDIVEDNRQETPYSDYCSRMYMTLDDAQALLQRTINDENELLRHRLKACHLTALLYQITIGSLNTAMNRVVSAGYEIHEPGDPQPFTLT